MCAWGLVAASIAGITRAAADLQHLIERIRSIASPLVLVPNVLPAGKTYREWFPGMDPRITVMNATLAEMLQGFGSPDVRQKLLDMMPKLTNAAMRFVAVSVIDYHSPKGDPDIAGKLQNKNEATMIVVSTLLLTASPAKK